MKEFKKMLFIPFLFCSIFLYAQTREDITVFVTMPVGGTSEQQMYFQQQFEMEVQGAGYHLADSQRSADYTLNLQIGPNMVLYDDGTQEQAPPDEPQYVLTILLMRNEDSVEIVQLSYLFTTLEEMYEENLSLLYQAMANVPLTRLGDLEIEPDYWRNKWFYLKFSAEFNVPVFSPDRNQYYMTGSQGESRNFPILTVVPFAPGATFGMELQMLNWMSAEIGLSLILGNVHSIAYTYDLIGTFDVSLKFPIKPPLIKHYMIEPFFGLAIPMAFASNALPSFGVQAGVQVAMKAGSSGGLFFNIRGEFDFGTTTTLDPNNEYVRWSRWVIGIGVGYKLGFYNR